MMLDELPPSVFRSNVARRMYLHGRADKKTMSSVGHSLTELYLLNVSLALGSIRDKCECKLLHPIMTLGRLFIFAPNVIIFPGIT